MSLRNVLVAGTCLWALCSAGAQAQLALSANDGKQPVLGTPITNVTPDTVAVIDLNHFPPKVIGTVEAPNSMIGAPVVIAVAHSERFALVANNQKLDPADPTKFIPDGTLSVIDLKDPRHPTVIQTLDGGSGASGISINKKDTLALVADTVAGSVTAFSIEGKKLTPAGMIQLDPKGGPTDVAISPDGKTALVAGRYGNIITELAIDGTKLTKVGEIATGRQTYGVVFSPKGDYAYNTNLGGSLTAADLQPGGAPQGPNGGAQQGANGGGGAAGAAGGPPRVRRPGSVSVIDVKAHKLVNSIDVGPTPEHLTLSADGKFLQLAIGNGSSATRPGAPTFGLLKIYSVDGPNLTEVTEGKTGIWGQGATWNKNHTLVLLQSGDGRDIEVWRFDGKNLVRQSQTLDFKGRPGSISTATSR